MSSSQRRFQNAESRISRRANNSSPYKSSKLPPAQVKTTSTFASLFSFLPNPFKRRTGPPQSLPQIEHSQQNSSRSDEESTDDEEPVERMETGDRLIRADDSMDDSMIVEDALNQSTYSVISTMTKRGEAIQREQQERQEQSNVPFPRLTDNTNTFSSSPSTSAFSTSPSKRRTAIPPPPLANHAQFRLSELGSPPKTHPAFGQPTSPTHNDQVKGIAEFIEARARSGHGNAQLTQDEIQQLNNLVSSTALDDPSLPSAALFGRGFVPSASKSFLAPPQQPQYSVPTFSIGTSSQSQRTLNRSSARRRPVYVGPGMGSNKRANGMMMNTSRSSILSPMPRSTTYGGLSTIKDDEGTGDGKRRRMDAAYGQQQGVASSASVPYSFNFGQSQMSGSQNTGLNVNGPNYERTTISPQPPSQLGINGVTSGSKSTAPNGMPSSASNGLLRPPLPSLNPPVKPSPLRNMTKATDSPSPPRSLTNQTASPPTVPQSISTAVPKPKSQSKTSTVVLGILNDVDKELSGNNKNKEIDEAVRNPYERVGVKVPVSMATTKKRNVSGSRRKPVEKKRDEDDVPDSVKGIEAALPSKRNKGSPAPVNGMVNGSSNRAPTSGSSPFLPPPRQVPRKTGASPAPTGKPTYTVDDVEIDEVEDEDEIMEVESIPSRRSPKPRKTGTFSSGSKSSKRASPPPPIVVEELSNGGSSSSGKPSLVIEPDNNVRYARSPSLGPPGQQQRFHSPSIPSPLRLVSMPDEVEEEDDIEIIDRPKYSDDVDMDGGKVGALRVPPSSSPPPAEVDEIMEEGEEDVVVGDDREIAKSKDEKALPKYVFDSIVVGKKSLAVLAGGSKEEEKAKQMELGKLPIFDFDFKAPMAITVGFMTTSSTSAPVVNNWAAAGWKPAAASVAGEWTCEVCGLKNPATAKDKCTVCGTDAPASFKGAASTSAPAPISAPPVVNNWAAAGWKPAASSAAGEWTCEVCGLKNPATVTDKCTVCASDAPPSVKGASATPASAPSSTPAPPVVNNWAAAGWKPSTSTSGEWTCNACDLKNPATEKEKCQICGEKAPASVNDSSSAPALGSSTNSAPLNLGPPTTSFNWTAAGLVQRALPAGGWKCPLCGLTNDAGDEKCKVCSQAKAS